MTKKYILRGLLCLLLCAAMLFIGGCSAARTARPTPRANKAVAVAGDTEIPYENL